ncbi:hypothetical protein FRC06_003325, partial [Ceratobasidium sp. 370]
MVSNLITSLRDAMTPRAEPTQADIAEILQEAQRQLDKLGDEIEVLARGTPEEAQPRLSDIRLKYHR